MAHAFFFEPEQQDRIFRQQMIKAINMSGDFKNKNDYTVTAFLGSKKVNVMRFVHDVKKYAQWLDQKKINWAVLNVYNRRSREFITRFYKGETIISKPKI